MKRNIGRSEEESSSEDSESDNEELGDDTDLIMTNTKQQDFRNALNKDQSTTYLNSEDVERVNIEFEFCDFDDQDVDMTLALLKQGALARIPNVSDKLETLANYIVHHKAVGTTVKVGDDFNKGELYSFASIINCVELRQLDFGENLFGFLLSHCPNSQAEKLKSILTSRSSGFLFNERIINVPRQLAKPLLRAVLDDIEWAKRNVKGGNEQFNYENIIILAPLLPLEPMQYTEKNKTKKPKTEEYWFLKFDEETFATKAKIKFRCRLVTKDVMVDNAKGHVPQRYKPKSALCCVIDMSSFKTIIKDLTD